MLHDSVDHIGILCKEGFKLVARDLFRAYIFLGNDGRAPGIGFDRSHLAEELAGIEDGQ